MAAPLPAGFDVLALEVLHIQHVHNNTVYNVDGCYVRFVVSPLNRLYLFVDAPPGLSITAEHTFPLAGQSTRLWKMHTASIPGVGVGIVFVLAQDLGIISDRDHPTPPPTVIPYFPSITIELLVVPGFMNPPAPPQNGNPPPLHAPPPQNDNPPQQAPPPQNGQPPQQAPPPPPLPNQAH